MIYVVTGFPRSGTSMMMACLAAGGLPAVSNPARAARVRQRDDARYQMNPGDVYESTQRERAEPGWPRQHDGAAVKVVVQWLGALAVHEYRVVLMRRDAEEIRQSFEAALGGRVTCERIEVAIDLARERLANRRDVHQLVELRYDDVLADPAGCLRSLEWPIDVEAAATVVDPTRKRFRRELLIEGA